MTTIKVTEHPEYDTTWPVRVEPGSGEQRVTLDLLGLALDGVSWQHLEEQRPGVAEALQQVVSSGYTAEQIRQYALDREMPAGWARWLEQAARFLEASDG